MYWERKVCLNQSHHVLGEEDFGPPTVHQGSMFLALLSVHLPSGPMAQRLPHHGVHCGPQAVVMTGLHV